VTPRAAPILQFTFAPAIFAGRALKKQADNPALGPGPTRRRKALLPTTREETMGLFDNALKNAIPGGDLATPIAVAVGALVLGSLFGKGGAASSPQPGAAPAPQPGSASASGGLLGGLSNLVQKFQAAGHGETVNSWIGTGANAPIQPAQVGSALGQQTISDLARQSGLSEQELLAQLALVLPGVVDKLTPNGRLPTQAELAAPGH
jgi:uncharacterized protein YidB (DUF937 family)